MEEPQKNSPESCQEVIPRMKTDSSILDYPVTLDPNQNIEKNEIKYQVNETVVHQEPSKSSKKSKICKPKSVTFRDPDSKYVIFAVILRFVILVKVILYSSILFKVPVLSILLIFELFGFCSLTSLRKKMMIFYVVFLAAAFVGKIIGIVDYAKNNSGSDSFQFVVTVLVSAEIIEGLQIVPQIVLTTWIYNMHESRIFEIYKKNIQLCCCCKKIK
jgi:hypothetical protein